MLIILVPSTDVDGAGMGVEIINVKVTLNMAV